MNRIALVAVSLTPILLVAGKPEIEREQREADRVVKELYLSKDAQTYCNRHPDGVYIAEYEGMPLPVECAVRNKWVELYLAGELPQEEGHKENG